MIYISSNFDSFLFVKSGSLNTISKILIKILHSHYDKIHK